MNNDQPMPTPGRVNVTPICRTEFLRVIDEQERKGIAKYGTTLQTHNGRDAGEDALQELADLAQYLTQLRMEYADAMDSLRIYKKRIEFLDRERESLVKENQRLSDWISGSHHHDKCETRYGRSCTCGREMILDAKGRTP